MNNKAIARELLALADKLVTADPVAARKQDLVKQLKAMKVRHQHQYEVTVTDFRNWADGEQDATRSRAYSDFADSDFADIIKAVS